MGELQLDFEEGVLSRIIQLVYRHTGISMTEKKENMIRTRLRPRMRELGLTTFDAYISHLENHENEIEVFVNLVTTNETSFFRTPRIWEYFDQEYLKTWKQNSTSAPLNIWSAAASSGEEAYSISMSCLEQGVTNFKVFGTDISTEVLQIADKGNYAGRNFVDFKKKFPALKDKYFFENGESMEARKILKEHVSFQTHNLFKPLKNPTKFDIVFLRNVLIYFNNEDQAKVLRQVSLNIKKGGILILGESESIFRLETSFKYKSPLIYINE